MNMNIDLKEPPGWVPHHEPPETDIEAADVFEPGTPEFACLAHLLSGRALDEKEACATYRIGATHFALVIRKIVRLGFKLAAFDVIDICEGKATSPHKRYKISK